VRKNAPKKSFEMIKNRRNSKRMLTAIDVAIAR
jgi:hypothetical protein